MPRVSRVKARHHAAAVPMPKRAFAALDDQVEQLLPGAEADLPVAEALAGPSSRPKKGLKFMPAPEILPSHPYSRSHTRRERRKAREHLAGGELHAVSAALLEAIGEEPEPSTARGAVSGNSTGQTREERGPAGRRAQAKEEGRLGEGKGRTMGESKRRKQIALEGRRIPAILAHPAFKKDPWATIRLHASNTLARKDLPAGAGGGARGVRMQVE